MSCENIESYATLPERMARSETQMKQVIDLLNRIYAKMDEADVEKRLQKVELTNKIIVWLFGILMLITVAITSGIGIEYFKMKAYAKEIDKYEIQRSYRSDDATTVLPHCSGLDEQNCRR